MKTQDKGSCGEYLVAAALMRNGYEVFMNTSFHGVSDLLASIDGQIYKVQVKTFYEKRAYGKYRKENSAYKVCEVRTSNMVDGDYHVSYRGLVDLIALADIDTGEVFLLDAGTVSNSCQISKSVVQDKKIFPVT